MLSATLRGGKRVGRACESPTCTVRRPTRWPADGEASRWF